MLSPPRSVAQYISVLTYRTRRNFDTVITQHRVTGFFFFLFFFFIYSSVIDVFYNTFHYGTIQSSRPWRVHYASGTSRRTSVCTSIVVNGIMNTSETRPNKIWLYLLRCLYYARESECHIFGADIIDARWSVTPSRTRPDWNIRVRVPFSREFPFPIK